MRRALLGIGAVLAVVVTMGALETHKPNIPRAGLQPAAAAGCGSSVEGFIVEPRVLPARAGEVVFRYHQPASKRGPMRVRVSRLPLPMRAGILTPSAFSPRALVGWQVFAYLPRAVETNAPVNVVFVMHGVNRDAEQEFRRSVPAGIEPRAALPEQHNVLLLVPEFSHALFPGRNAYNFGDVVEDEDPARRRPRERWAFSSIDGIFTALRTALHLNAQGFHLFGHSAGAQFVHRFVAFTNST